MKFLMSCLVVSAFFIQSTHAQSVGWQQELKDRVDAVSERLDKHMLLIEIEDYVVSMYQQILKKNPTETEALTMELLLSGHGMYHVVDKSYFVEQLLVLKEDKDQLTWEDVEKNIDMLENLKPNALPVTGVYPNRFDEDDIIEADKKKRYLKPLKNSGDYNVYFGYLHAHSELSDGRGEARWAYHMAKEEAGLDYFALTDHSELLHFWPWSKKYKQLRKVANEFNEDGRFAGLYGFEWSHPLLGHFNVINTKRYTSAILRPTMGSLMRWLGRRDHAFGRFNHPGRINKKWWPYEFRKFKVYKKALHNVVGIEMWNKKDGLKEYVFNRESFEEGYNFLDNANMQGWFVGTVGGQDNHDADWGLRNDFRVGVWAEELTRQSIVDAYLGRRTFATEDKNAWVSFKMGGAQMGSRLVPGEYNVEIIFGDEDDEDLVTSAQLIGGGNLIKEFTVGEAQTLSANIQGQVDDYFYVVAEQDDGDLLVSSPIWIVP